MFRFSAAGERERGVSHAGNGLECLRLTLPVEQIGIRDGILLVAGCFLIQRYKTTRVRKRNGMEKDAIDDAEDRRIPPYTQAESEQRGECETGTRSQLPHRVPYVVQQIFQQRRRALGAPGLFHHRYTTELEQCLASRLRGRHACPYVVGHMHIEMTLEFFGYFRFPALFAEQPSEPHDPTSERPHDGSFAGVRKRARIAVAWVQSRVSLSSCFRPARVNR